MKTFQVNIIDQITGSFVINAEDEQDAEAEAQKRLELGDTSWHQGHGVCEVMDIDELDPLPTRNLTPECICDGCE